MVSILVLSTQIERAVHRDADAPVEVGSVGSTPNLGKPSTWGSDRQDDSPVTRKHLLHSEVG